MSRSFLNAIAGTIRNDENVDDVINNTVYSRMNQQLKRQGMTPIDQVNTSAPLETSGTTTDAQTKQYINSSSTLAPPETPIITGSGVIKLHPKTNPYFSLKNNSDNWISPLHPAFHPVPNSFLRPELLVPL
jgi:hypothetical protein